MLLARVLRATCQNSVHAPSRFILCHTEYVTYVVVLAFVPFLASLSRALGVRYTPYHFPFRPRSRVNRAGERCAPRRCDLGKKVTFFARRVKFPRDREHLSALAFAATISFSSVSLVPLSLSLSLAPYSTSCAASLSLSRSYHLLPYCCCYYHYYRYYY